MRNYKRSQWPTENIYTKFKVETGRLMSVSGTRIFGEEETKLWISGQGHRWRWVNGTEINTLYKTLTLRLTHLQ